MLFNGCIRFFHSGLLLLIMWGRIKKKMCNSHNTIYGFIYGDYIYTHYKNLYISSIQTLIQIGYEYSPLPSFAKNCRDEVLIGSCKVLLEVYTF
ncbi:hypothetical protein HanIR_Chr15g0774171 [Helianthus annuus]|nr:hypothetical protein HanIR_Chr15g0774171 [Helianthus annuus]